MEPWNTSRTVPSATTRKQRSVRDSRGKRKRQRKPERRKRKRPKRRRRSKNKPRRRRSSQRRWKRGRRRKKLRPDPQDEARAKRETGGEKGAASLGTSGGLKRKVTKAALLRRTKSNLEKKSVTRMASESSEGSSGSNGSKGAKEKEGGLKVPKRKGRPKAKPRASPSPSKVKREQIAAEVARRKSTLKQQMLPELTPERNKKAISHVRKMIEGFIDAATAKAEIEVEKATLGEGGADAKKKAEEQKNLFNMEIAARRLILMAQRGDWIAFEQALK